MKKAKNIIILILSAASITSCSKQLGTTKSSHSAESFSAGEALTASLDTRAIEIQEVEKMLDCADGIQYEFSDSKYNFTGRWYEKEIDGISHYITVNDGSELYFAAYGTNTVDIYFTVITEKKTPYFAYSIDGSEPVRQLITESAIPLPDKGAHIIRIITDGITESERKFSGEIGFAFREADAGNGKIIGIKPVSKTIMFFGDSITEGVRALSMDADSDGNSATHSYPWYCCRSLGAIPVNVGFAASGIVGAGSFAPCLETIDKLSATRNTDSIPAPDIVILAHGHNDIYFSSADFVPRYNAVLRRLHEKYPDTKIVILIPFSQTHAEDIRSCASEFEFIKLIETDGWNPATTDGIHLSAAGAKTAGFKLASELEKIFGEDYF